MLKETILLSNDGKSKPFEIIESEEDLKNAQGLYNSGNYQESYKKFSETLESKDFVENKNLEQTVKLYKTAALLGYDREKAFKEYYEFSKDEMNTLENRGYAILMAQQNVTAFNDPKKLLFFLSENEVKEMEVLDNKNMQYAISKKVFTLFPFPITAARLAAFEIDNLEIKKGEDVKVKVQSIYDKYMYNFDKNINYMENIVGFRHLVANSLNARASLSGRLEDFGIVKSAETGVWHEKAIEKAVLYSPRGTKHFLMISFLEHEVKVKNQEKIDKILNAFLEEKKVGKIDSRVIKNLTDEKIMQELYPNIYALYVKDPEFKEKLLAVFNK